MSSSLQSNANLLDDIIDTTKKLIAEINAEHYRVYVEKQNKEGVAPTATTQSYISKSQVQRHVRDLPHTYVKDQEPAPNRHHKKKPIQGLFARTTALTEPRESAEPTKMRRTSLRVLAGMKDSYVQTPRPFRPCHEPTKPDNTVSRDQHTKGCGAQTGSLPFGILPWVVCCRHGAGRSKGFSDLSPSKLAPLAMMKLGLCITAPPWVGEKRQLEPMHAWLLRYRNWKRDRGPKDIIIWDPNIKNNMDAVKAARKNRRNTV
ncbi:MAG: hypothetical protein M1835_003865 [Candelina submexicana]|nr:MAG: hypothetical protein M1835_003865 [Candelina submexicana]